MLTGHPFPKKTLLFPIRYGSLTNKQVSMELHSKTNTVIAVLVGLSTELSPVL